MAVLPGYWGIDIGQCALKAIRLEIIDNKVTATAFDYVEHPKILSQPDADPELLTREALEKFLSRNPIKGDKVAISVPGQSGLARFVKLPPVEEKKIEDIVKFEAKQQIPFPLEEVVWDYQKVSDGAVEGGFAIDTEIGLFAMKRDMISRVMNHFQGVNVEVHFIQMSPLALCNYVTYDILNRGGPDAPEAPPPPTLGQKKKCMVVLDVGTDGSNLIITDGGKIIWQRPIPIGGNHFTRALTKELKLTFAKAEHLKRNAAKSPELANILKALKPVLTDFVGEVQRSLGYFTNTHRDAQVEYLIGLGSAFKLPGLQKYLGDKLQLRVEKPTKFLRLSGESVTNAPVFIENVLTFPVAYGLALQSLGVARLRTNLLPPEIAWDRKIRAKKPWVVAAAACLFIGTGMLALGYSAEYAAVNDPRIAASLGKFDNASKEARKVDGDIAAKQTEVNKTVENVQAIIAGKDEHLNWIRMQEFVNSCLPVPGNDGNMKGAQRRLWDSKDGDGGGPAAATEKYFQRIRKGVDPKLAYLDDDMRQYLAAVDLEAVHCRFTPDLAGFFANAKQYCLAYAGKGDATFDSMDPEERTPMMEEKPVYPTGKAWIFEIRGTTCYEHRTVKGPEFLVKTLLANLKEASKSQNTDPTIRNKISHIFLYKTWRDENPRPDAFYFIKTSLIDYLVPLAAIGPDFNPIISPPPGPGEVRPIVPVAGTPGATGTPTYNRWYPLAKVDVGGDVGSAPPPSDDGAPSATNPYQNLSIPEPPKPTTSPDAKEPDKKVAPPKPRYEFVILFIWREDTPSDALVTKIGPDTPLSVALPPKEVIKKIGGRGVPRPPRNN